MKQNQVHFHSAVPQEFGSAVESIPLFREGVHLEQVIITFMVIYIYQLIISIYVLNGLNASSLQSCVNPKVPIMYLSLLTIYECGQLVQNPSLTPNIK